GVLLVDQKPDPRRSRGGDEPEHEDPKEWGDEDPEDRRPIAQRQAHVLARQGQNPHRAPFRWRRRSSSTPATVMPIPKTARTARSRRTCSQPPPEASPRSASWPQ